jgi:FtsZ-binding cell division protein ZapB
MTGSDRALARLEKSAVEVVELLARVQVENTSLKDRNEELNKRLEELKKETQAKNGAIERLKGERLTTRARVEGILQKVAALEES